VRRRRLFKVIAAKSDTTEEVLEMPKMSNAVKALFSDADYPVNTLSGRKGTGKNGSIIKKDAVLLIEEFERSIASQEEE